MRLYKISSVTFLLILISSILSGYSIAQEESELEVGPGILPDSYFYFIDELFEIVNDNPERALRYKEEKIAEALALAEQRKAEFALKALENAAGYGEFLEKEATPEMEEKIKGKSDAIKRALNAVAGNVPELRGEVDKHLDLEARIALASQISSKIKKLCEVLSELDPKQYAGVCRTSEDSPKWHKNLDQKLTREQQEHAEIFAKKLRECFGTYGRVCDCKGMGVQSFEQLCISESTKAAACAESEDKAACIGGSGPIDFSDYLPEYLLPVMEELGLEMAGEPDKKGYDGKFDDSGSDKGLMMSDEELMKECMQYMSKEECIEKIQSKGKGSGDEQGLAVGQPPRIEEFGRDCHAVSDLSEKARCFEDFYNKAHSSFEKGFDRKYKDESDYKVQADNWVIPFAERWLSAQSDEEREKVKNEFYAEIGRLGIDKDKIKLEVSEDSFEFEYEQDGIGFKTDYKIDYKGNNRYYTEEDYYEDDYPGEGEDLGESGYKPYVCEDEPEKMACDKGYALQEYDKSGCIIGWHCVYTEGYQASTASCDAEPEKLSCTDGYAAQKYDEKGCVVGWYCVYSGSSDAYTNTRDEKTSAESYKDDSQQYPEKTTGSANETVTGETTSTGGATAEGAKTEETSGTSTG